MTEDRYLDHLQESLDDVHLKMFLANLLNWYYKRARLNKWLYYTFAVTSLVSLSLIPVANSFLACDSGRFYVTLLSSVSIIFVGIIAICNLKNSWLRYRTSLENLKLECLLYIECHGDYAIDDPKQRKSLFIEHLKIIASSECHQWGSALEKSSLPHGMQGG